MSGWLIFWLVLMALGPVAFLIAWACDDRIDDGYEALGIFTIVLMLGAVSAVGFLGFLGWLGFWAHGVM